MKKILSMVMMFSLLSIGFSSVSFASAELPAGTVIKGDGLQTLYYLGEDGKRYVFPNSKIYFSWFENFGNVVELSMDELVTYPLGGNVKYKPGALLVKIKTDPKVYAVSKNGKLRWVKSEAIAKALYGKQWNKLVDDVPDSFFTDYSVSDPIENEDDYEPDVELEEAETISHNKGFRHFVRKMRKKRKHIDKRCGALEHAVNKLQKRAARLGMEIDGAGDEFVNECVGKAWANVKDKIRSRLSEKVEICHMPVDGSNPQTLEVAKIAARVHLKHGDTLGECEESDSSEEEADDSTTNSDEEIDDSSDDTSTSSDDVIDTSDDSSSTSTDDSTDATEDDDSGSDASSSPDIL